MVLFQLKAMLRSSVSLNFTQCYLRKISRLLFLPFCLMMMCWIFIPVKTEPPEWILIPSVLPLLTAASHTMSTTTPKPEILSTRFTEATRFPTRKPTESTTKATITTAEPVTRPTQSATRRPQTTEEQIPMTTESVTLFDETEKAAAATTTITVDYTEIMDFTTSAPLISYTKSTTTAAATSSPVKVSDSNSTVPVLLTESSSSSAETTTSSQCMHNLANILTIYELNKLHYTSRSKRLNACNDHCTSTANADNNFNAITSARIRKITGRQTG